MLFPLVLLIIAGIGLAGAAAAFLGSSVRAKRDAEYGSQMAALRDRNRFAPGQAGGRPRKVSQRGAVRGLLMASGQDRRSRLGWTKKRASCGCGCGGTGSCGIGKGTKADPMLAILTLEQATGRGCGCG